jgi:hypothetical protein
MTKIALAFVLAVAAALTHAQTIYQCANLNGSMIYSQTPCGSNAKLIMNSKPKPKNDESSEGPADSAAPKPKTMAGPDPNIKAISDSVEDSDCRRAAQRLYIEPDISEINSLKAQVYELENTTYVSARTGEVTANSQIMGQNDRTRAASIRNTIAIKEQENASTRADSRRAMREALSECDRKKSEREKSSQ